MLRSLVRWPVRTLRRRITAGLVAVLLVAFVVIGTATAIFLRHFLLHRLDTQLSEAGSRAISLEHGHFAPGGDDGDADNSAPGQSVGTLGVRLAAGRVTDAAVVERDGHDRTVHFGRTDVALLRSLPVDAAPRTVHLAGLGEYRVEASAGRDHDVRVTGLPLRDVDEILHRLILIEVALSTVVIVVTGLVTAFGVGRALRPLRRVADTALHVSQLPLTEAATRLPAGLAPAEPTTEADQVSAAFDHMLDHVRAALSARDHTEATLRHFVADASHELRTPLATVRAHAEFVLRSDDGLRDETAAALSRIDDAAVRMTAIVDDLLLLARLDAGRPLADDVVDVSQLVLDTVDDARTAGCGHRWHLELPEHPVEIRGDGQRLHQVLANLLTNARVHTPEGTVVTTSLVEDGDRVAVTVSDDGPGIPDALLPDVFDRFARGGHARPPGTGSSGLGLAIAHGIVTAHRGTIDVRSRPGLTVFTVRLPRTSAPGHAPAPFALNPL